MSLKTGQVTARAEGFGTFFGVYVPSMLTIFGVVLYLHFGQMLSSHGLVQTLLIISLAFLITFITSLSIAAIATNMQVGKGGAYYLISRSFGVEVGGAIGLPLFFAQAIGIAFYILCFAESAQHILPQFSMREIGLATLCILTALTYLSSQLALHSQFLVVGLISAALLSLFSGETPSQTSTLFTEAAPSSFWKTFAALFPAVTGIEVGLSLSGNLREPRRSLPWGTIAAVVTGYLVYLTIPLFLWWRVPQELLSDPSLLEHVSHFGKIVLLALWGGALSSALSGILAAPRTLQALAKDRVVPQILAQESIRGKDPHLATLVVFLIPTAALCFGSIDLITPVLTMFFLMAYGMLNFSAAMEGILGNPSWRPTFEVPWTVSLAGAALCLMAMLMIDAGSTFVAAFLVMAVYALVRRRHMRTRWDDIRQGILLFFSRFAVYRLAHTQLSIRSWRPNFLAFTATPSMVSPLIEFTSAITHNKGFLTMASILSSKIANTEKALQMERRSAEFLKKHKIQALVEVHIAPDVISGIKELITSYGLGPLVPNTVVFGENGQTDQILAYAEVIQLAQKHQRNVVIIRSTATSAVHSTIDILWDDDVRENSELMLVLAHMLQKSAPWRGSTVHLKSTVSNEIAQRQRQEYFATFCQTSRLNVKIDVRTDESDFSSSSPADLTFVSLRPLAAEESAAEYSRYYEQLLKTTSHLPLTAYVMSAQPLDLHEMLR